MSEKQLKRQAFIQGGIDGKYTVGFLSKKLGLSRRRIFQLKKAYKEKGVESLIHGNSGRHPANTTGESIRKKICDLKKSEKYKDVNFAYFCELLEELEGIKVAYPTLCGILKKTGIVSPKTHSKKKGFKRRKRRSQFGELLQADATPYDWLNNGVPFALHGSIDDATGTLTGLYLCKNECLLGYIEILRQTLINYGVPLDYYTDKAGVFFINSKKKENWSAEEIFRGKCLERTQFGRMCDELGINLIGATTPQAKGRIERCWQTIQGRLPTFLKVRGITTIEDANKVLPDFIKEFNKKFDVVPEQEESSFVPLTEKEKTELDKILAIKHERKTDGCGCFSFYNIKFSISSEKIIAKKSIYFLFNEKIGFKAKVDNKYYDVVLSDVLNTEENTHIPIVTKKLLEKFFLTNTKEDSSGGEIFACNY